MTQRAALHLAKIIGDLNGRWTPHPTQQLMLNALFLHGFLLVFGENGRKWGKTEIIAYFLWRRAMTIPGGHYYFAPEQKQAKEIIWAAGRLQSFGPESYVDGKPNDTEMRIWVKNPIGESFIKVDGSDNFNSHRGTEPTTLVYDEYRDFRPEFHEVMDPNRLPHKAPLLVMSTPPEVDIEHYDSMKTGLEVGKTLFNFPSWLNPYNDRKWLEDKKKELYTKGEGDSWEREYAAKKVRGGKRSIFPMFAAPDLALNPPILHTKHVRPHAEVMAAIQRDKKKMIWQIICDPGNMTCFAVLFRAINPFTKCVYRLDEIYETRQLETSTSKIVPRIITMREELLPGWEAYGIEWDQHYDEAETWFATEALNSFGEVFTPTSKGTRDIDEGLSLLKDQMLSGLTVISDRCINLCTEIKNFIKDPKTGRPHRDCQDHLVDCDRYGNDLAGIDLTPEQEPEAPDQKEAPRFRTPDQDLDDAAFDEDEAFGVLDDF